MLNTTASFLRSHATEAAKTNDGWYGSILKKSKYASPLSLKVSLRLVREGRYQTLDGCLIRESRLTSRAISCKIASDFCEDNEELGLVKRISDKRTKNQAKTDKSEHGTERAEKAKVKKSKSKLEPKMKKY
ncbi:3-hydroxyisobutyryl-CoA hydrolase-like protein 1, mitochondrial [Tanacetum coccineum]